MNTLLRMFDSSYGGGLTRAAPFVIPMVCVSFGAVANAQESGATRVTEEVVVTAQKREERLQDVPISISVLSGDYLDKSNDSVARMLNRIPGVISYVGNNDSRLGRSGGQVVVRGVASAAGAATTAYYLDSIPFGFLRNNYAPDPDAYDLDRLEVLRGPQGTLYGSSALNGVVRVLTKDPDLTSLGFKARALTSQTHLGGTNYRGDAALNIPIVEGKLAARMIVGHDFQSGWIDRPLDDDANDLEKSTYRLKIKAVPMEGMSVDLFGWVSRQDVGAPAHGTTREFNSSVVDEPSLIDYDAFGGTISYDFSAVSIKSMTSYIDYVNDSNFDYSPLNVINVLFSRGASKVFAEEINVSSLGDGPWRWTAGAMYRDSDESLYQFRQAYLAPTRSATTSESYAVFAEVTRALLDGRLELTGGLRYFEDRIVDTELSRFSVAGGVPATGFPPPARSTFDNVSPRAVISWHPNKGSTLYASYSEGFRSGINQLPVTAASFPQIPPAGPDTLKNYEVGAKGGFMGGRITYDTSVYYIKWEDIQQALTVNLGTFLTSATVNAPAASGPGVDLALTMYATDGLTLGASVSWNDLTFDENTISGTSILFPKDGRILSSPELTAGVSLDYGFDIGTTTLSGRFSTSANYVSERLSYQTSPTNFEEADEIVMARASFAIESRSGWTGSLFVDNLTDEEGYVPDRFSPRWDAWIRPRTVGMQFEYSY